MSKEIQDELGVADAKLGGVIKDKLGISCVADSRVSELLRGIRSQMTSLIEGLDDAQLKAMVDSMKNNKEQMRQVYRA